jgi:hypothetical protein
MISGIRVTGNTGKIFPHLLHSKLGIIKYAFHTGKADMTPFLSYVFVIPLYRSASTANVMKYRMGHDIVIKNVCVLMYQNRSGNRACFPVSSYILTFGW